MRVTSYLNFAAALVAAFALGACAHHPHHRAAAGAHHLPEKHHHFPQYADRDFDIQFRGHNPAPPYGPRGNTAYHH